MHGDTAAQTREVGGVAGRPNSKQSYWANTAIAAARSLSATSEGGARRFAAGRTRSDLNFFYKSIHGRDKKTHTKKSQSGEGRREQALNTATDCAGPRSPEIKSPRLPSFVILAIVRHRLPPWVTVCSQVICFLHRCHHGPAAHTPRARSARVFFTITMRHTTGDHSACSVAR